MSRIFISFSALFLALLVVPEPAQATESFVSFLINLKYDSTDGKIYDTSNRQLRVIAENPEISRLETKNGLLFIFKSKGKEILRIERRLGQGSEFSLDAIIDQITYHGKTSTALSTLSLQLAPRSREELCRMSKDLGSFQRMLKTDTNRIGLKNNGGFGGVGVCWWFNRFERKAAYLAYYSPQKPKPSRNRAIRIIRELRTGRKIVEIPGYENLKEFTEDFSDEMQAALDAWQVSDTIFRASFLHGLKGSTEVRAEELKAIMDQTFDSVVRRKKLAFQMLQMPGYSAHSWLVVGMNRSKDGYEMQVADSNFTGQLNRISYQEGMTKLTYVGRDFVPYSIHAYDRENDRIISDLRAACRK